MRKKIIFFFIVISVNIIFSQQKQFTVKFTQSEFEIDGVLNELAWTEAESVGDFNQYFPSDSILANKQTDIKMLFNDNTLFIGIKLYTDGRDFVIPSLKRDFRAGGNDNISLLFDTFNDGTNAFLFGMNPLGVMREALISGGGSDLRGFNTTWDVKWTGEAAIFDDYYSLEIAIPLTSLKFKDGTTKFRFNSYRFNTSENEQSTSAVVPQNQLIFNLAFMDDMVFEKPLGKSKAPIAIIPYVNLLSSEDYVNDISETKSCRW